MNIGRKNIRKWMLSGMAVLWAASGVKAQNVIQQDTALYRFFAALQHADSNVVSVLHLGDSHVQAGYLPLTTGGLLQQQFGNAGRGWVFPFNLAGTNGPEDYRWNSTVRWQSDRVVDRAKTGLLGPGAIAITTHSTAPTIGYNGREMTDTNYDFNEAILFYDAGTTADSIIVPEAAVTVTPTPFPGASTTCMATLSFPSAVRNFQARWEGTGASPFRFFGAVLRNGHNGVLYHGIGINGAMYQQYNESNEILMAQTAVLKPQLVIISLGTNEAYGRPDAVQFINEIDKTVQLIREQAPEAAILLTTPPDCMRVSRRAYRKKSGKRYKTYYRTAYYPNPYISMVTSQLQAYARQQGIACWNFNAVNKIQHTKFAGAWAADHIHFNARGYQLQGTLLFEALEEAYHQYTREIKQHASLTAIRP